MFRPFRDFVAVIVVVVVVVVVVVTVVVDVVVVVVSVVVVSVAVAVVVAVVAVVDVILLARLESLIERIPKLNSIPINSLYCTFYILIPYFLQLFQYFLGSHSVLWLSTH